MATTPTNASSALEGSPRPWWSSDCAVGFALSLLVALTALQRPLASLATHSMGDWTGLARQYPLLRSDVDVPESVSGGGDPLRQFVPWAVFARQELGEGRVPLWNPHCGTGVPHLASFQSAVLSPFTAPYYVLPLAWAMLVSSALRVMVATFGAFLFLRRLDRSRFAAGLGAVSYGMGGFHLLYPLHPHTGVLASVPLALLAVQCAMQSFASDPRRLPWSALAGLALALGLMVFAGHPESLLFGVEMVALFAAFRLGQLAWERRRSAALGRVAALAFATFATGLAGGALGAVQLVPFFEYLARSSALAAAGRELGTWSWNDLLIQFLPDAHGRVVGASWADQGILPAAHESAAFFSGGSTLVLAACALLLARREVLAWCFTALAGGLLLYLFEVPIVASLLRPLFGRDYVFASRATPLWSMPVCALAAFAVDGAFARPKRAALTFLALGASVLVSCRIAMHEHLEALRAQDAMRFDALRPGELLSLDALSACFLLALIGVAVAASSAARALRAASVLAALGATVAQGALGYSELVPIAPDAAVGERTPALDALARAAGGERVVLLTTKGLPPNVNVPLAIDLATSYDALEVRELDQLRGRLFGYTGYGGLTLRASRRALDLFGVRLVATPGEWLPIDTERSSELAEDRDARWFLGPELGLPREPRALELGEASYELREEFESSRAGLDGLVVHFLEPQSAPASLVRVRVDDLETGATLATREVRLGELRRLGAERLECVVEVPRQLQSRGRKYAAVVEAPALARGERIQLLTERWGERVRFVLDVSYGRGDFEQAGVAGHLVLHRYAAGRGRAWVAARSEAVRDPTAALERVLAADFDARGSVVLERGDAPDSAAPADARSDVEWLERGPQRLRLRATTSHAGYLVLAQAHFPGWSARVGGAPAELERANFAFSAVALPAGVSEVELTYEPASFRVGLAITLAAAAMIACAAWSGRASRAGAASRAESPR